MKNGGRNLDPSPSKLILQSDAFAAAFAFATVLAFATIIVAATFATALTLAGIFTFAIVFTRVVARRVRAGRCGIVSVALGGHAACQQSGHGCSNEECSLCSAHSFLILVLVCRRPRIFLSALRRLR
jgi:hypothetical protein